MMNFTKSKLSQFLIETRQEWDHDRTRSIFRREAKRVINCRDPRFGANVFRSDSGTELVVPFTCKSRLCSSCGHKSMLCWQQQVAFNWPEIEYAGVTFTMHEDLWGVFQANRGLLEGLAPLASGVIQDWVAQKYGAEVMICVVRHTFGSYLNFNPHIHMIVSTVGLDDTGTKVVRSIKFSRDQLMRRWRHALLDYLELVLHQNKIRKFTTSHIENLLKAHRDRWWSVKLQYFTDARPFLNYISRYLLRPCVAEHKLRLNSTGQAILRVHDKRKGKTVEQRFNSKEFLERLSDQVLDRYTHGVRYFGLLAPRAKHTRFEILLRLLQVVRRPRPKRLRWRALIERCFHRDPLLDEGGQELRWSHRTVTLRPYSTVSARPPT